MDESLKNEVVFTNLNGIYIIKCECLDILKYYSEYKIYNIDLASYYCDKVRIIELYDINKNIVDYIIDPIYNNPLKKGSIINLESFKENILFEQNFYFKTFERAYIEKNKINNIKYYISDTGEIKDFTNDIVHFHCFYDFLKFNGSDYCAYFYDNNEVTSHYINSSYNYLNITYYLYNQQYDYNKIEIYIDKIKIIRKKKVLEVYIHQQIIICNKELKILQVLEQKHGNILYEENRDVNDVIIDIKKYNPNTDKLETVLSNNNNSILIKSEKKFPQELLDFYNSDISYLDKLIVIRNYEFINAKNELLKVLKDF